jgi:hypothetical protein
MEHSSLDCSFSQKIRAAALLAAPFVLSAATASAEVVKHDLNVSASYFGTTYFNLNPWTGAVAQEGAYADAAYPLTMYFCGADGGALSQVTGSARWAATVDLGMSDQYSAWGAPTVFSEGSVIGADTTFLTANDNMNYYAPNAGFAGFTVDANLDQYFGFSYKNGADMHYGYIQFRLSPNQTEFWGNMYDDPIITFTASYVNTTPGESITIGGSPIPEPAGASLLFGAVAAGAIACRRPRRGERG